VDVFSGACLFVSVFVRKITSERLNVGQSNLVVRYSVQKSRPSSKVKVTRDKKYNEKLLSRSSPLTLHSEACAVGGTQQASTDDTIAWPLGVTGYAGGKINA